MAMTISSKTDKHNCAHNIFIYLLLLLLLLFSIPNSSIQSGSYQDINCSTQKAELVYKFMTIFMFSIPGVSKSTFYKIAIFYQ